MDPATLVWAECEAVVHRPGGQVVLVAADGSSLTVDPADWATGAVLAEQLAG